MPYFYLSLMSSRIFHSNDIEGLRQALVDEPSETGAQPEPHAARRRPNRGRQPARIVPTRRATAKT